jgi:hypothetical protein
MFDERGFLAAMRVKVPEDETVTGADLMAAVEIIATSGSPNPRARFHSVREGDRFLIGRTSGYVDLQLVVGPTLTDLFVERDKTYPEFVVVSYRWPGMTFDVNYTGAQVAQAVCDFAVALDRHLIKTPWYQR